MNFSSITQVNLSYPMNTLHLSKETMIDAIDRFETKHLLYIEYPTMLRNCFIIGILIGNVARLYYNTFEEYLNCMFELSWTGLGWGKTPPHIQLITCILALLFAISYNYYAFMVNMHGSLKTRLKLNIEKHGPGYLYRDDKGNLKFKYDSDDDDSDYNPEDDEDNEESGCSTDEDDEESDEGSCLNTCACKHCDTKDPAYWRYNSDGEYEYRSDWSEYENENDEGDNSEVEEILSQAEENKKNV